MNTVQNYPVKKIITHKSPVRGTLFIRSVLLKKEDWARFFKTSLMSKYQGKIVQLMFWKSCVSKEKSRCKMSRSLQQMMFRIDHILTWQKNPTKN